MASLPGTVKVLFFATAREAAGERQAEHPWAGLAVSQVRPLLAASYGDAMAPVLSTCAIWVNGGPPAPGYLLAEGDELAVLPPVSGGCAALPSH